MSRFDSAKACVRLFVLSLPLYHSRTSAWISPQSLLAVADTELQHRATQLSFFNSFSSHYKKKFKKKKNQNPNFLYFPKPQFILYLFAQISSSVQTLKPRETLLILFFFFHSSSCFFSRLQTLFYEINKTQLTTYAYLVSMVLNFTTTERKIVFRTVWVLALVGMFEVGVLYGDHMNGRLGFI